MIGRVIVLILLIIVLSVGGIIWFDYLNVIDAKFVLAPIYIRIPWIGEPRTQPRIDPDDDINLDTERLTLRLQALEIQSLEIDAKEKGIIAQYGEIEQIVQEIKERQQILDDIENSLKAEGRDAEDVNRNIEQNARNLNNMPPQNAVSIINVMDNQLAIDVIRKTEEIARAEGRRSIVPFWFSLMEPARAAELQRLMAGRPSSL
jgi:flagellar protein FlbB